MAAPRLRKTSSQKEMENLIDDYITQGYEVIERGERSTMLRKKTWGSSSGHVLWICLTGWWTFGLGNLVYALIAHNSAESVFLKWEQE